MGRPTKTSKSINGKRYTLTLSLPSKVDAQAHAQIFRDEGWSARVTKRVWKGRYFVYRTMYFVWIAK